MSLREPWIAIRLVAALTAASLFVHAAWIGTKILRFERVGSTSEGQLALERQAELGAATARVGAVIQVLGLLLSVLAADRLTVTIRGAMCGYGVVHANAAGPWSIALTCAAAVAAGVLLQLLKLDDALRKPFLRRPIAIASMVVALVSLTDFRFVWSWLGELDLSVVASCCSSGADAGATTASGFASGPRVPMTIASLVAVPAAIVTAFLARRSRSRSLALSSGFLSVAALPLALETVVLEVAPHVYEVPHHRCAYCLFRHDAWFIGYPLFGAIFLAVVWAVGAAMSAWLTPRDEVSNDAFVTFAPPVLGREALAWMVALLLAAIPIVRFAIVAPGASLF
ncbi:MAG: hypothetical protein U0165_18210 [Polyangiaceae bacterium]